GVTNAAEITKLKARIAEPETELARERAKKAPPQPPPLNAWDFSPERKQAVAEARKTERAAARAAKAAQAGAQEPPETIETLTEKLDRATAELVKRNTRVANLRKQVRMLADKRTIAMTKPLHKHIVACIHPDRASQDARTQRLWTERAQQFA